MFLGIDIGTSGVKVCLIDAKTRVIGDATMPLTISHPRPGWSEQTPADWWAAVVAATRTVLEAHPGTAGRIEGIGLSGQMHGAVLLDAACDVIRPAILWNDGRSEAQCAEITARDPALAEIAGVRPMAGFTAPKLMWLARHEPEAYGRVAHILLPKDWIGYRLHGGLVTDPSDAAGTFWLDQAAATWSDALCDATGTQIGWLPELRAGNAVAGMLQDEAAQALGLPAGLPVAAGAGDAAAGAVAIGAIREGEGFISLGTSGQVFLPTATYRAAPEAGVHSFAHTLPGLWFQMAAILNGARPMSWFADVAQAPIPTLLDEASRVNLDRLPLFLPYLTGERTPHGDTDIRAGFYGLSNGTGRAEMMRAVLDAIAMSLADATAAIASATPLPRAMLTLGGGARSDLLLQTIADATGLTLERGEKAEIGPAYGAALLGASAVGAGAIETLVRRPDVTARFAPSEAGAARLAPRLEAYRALYQALKPISRMAY
ncbi:xylulokinase [Roseivivax lentus]|uniref:Xylulose kinase n=1 Tax=Roseivivax lentus TaxID=633194 RepID=A0A1N7KDM6_9RHOB|nr:xylulokinase [Roseivivax lentus]SIS59705.1 xylulokinase [Roseivivax lentus]